MYKVLIVDDESYVVKSLHSTIDWSEYGYEVIGQAGNGVEALELIGALKPDLVFADVKMPGMGGLELIRIASGQYPDVLFIMISGHAEFSYAQNAMNNGALGYCLKPFEDSEIISMLGKASARLNQQRAAAGLKLLEELEDVSDEKRLRASRTLEKLGVTRERKDGKLQIAVSIGSGLLSFPLAIQAASLRIGNNKHLYILDERYAAEARRHLQAWFPRGVKGIGWRSSVVAIEAAIDDIEAVIEAAYQFFITGKAGLFETGKSVDAVHPALQRLGEALERKDLKTIRDVLASLGSDRSQLTIRHALRIYNTVMSYLYRSDTDKLEDYAYSYEHLARLYPDFGQMTTELLRLLDRSVSYRATQVPRAAKNDTFQSILKFIDEHYEGDISIQSISRRFDINPNYVSQLFKKNLGETFTDYIARMRMKQAGQLLQTTTLPVHEIASRVGYDEYYYFARVFKKITGQTPSDFRSSFF